MLIDVNFISTVKLIVNQFAVNLKYTYEFMPMM